MTTSKSWLTYPRTFRLQYEAKEEHSYINVGPSTMSDATKSSIDLMDWQGTMYLTKYDTILSFSMVCTEEFPNVEPKIKFENNVIVKKLKEVCDKDFNLTSKFNWTKSKSIIDNLLPIYNILNS